MNEIAETHPRGAKGQWRTQERGTRNTCPSHSSSIDVMLKKFKIADKMAALLWSCPPLRIFFKFLRTPLLRGEAPPSYTIISSVKSFNRKMKIRKTIKNSGK